MRFFNIDQHVSVIADLAHIFKDFGHETDDWTLSGHNWVLNKPKNTIRLGTSALTCSGVCSEEVCDIFYETYKEEFKKYDAFIACYPAEFAMLYERWNKPIIVINCIRYQHPNTFDNPHLVKRLEDFMARKTADGTLYWVCSNRGDQWYTEYHTGIKGTFIPHWGTYTNLKYTGTKDKYIIANRTEISVSGDLAIPLSSIRDSNWRYTWENLYSYKGVIHIPYANSTSSMHEQYTANVPQFFPSKQYCKEIYHQGKALEELTFYKINKKQEPDDINNPNSLRNPAILEKWLDTSDYYDPKGFLKYIQYYDSPAHLDHLLRTVNAREISNDMSFANIAKKEYAYSEWKKILDSIKNKT
jgi:hypothetical protein